MYLPLQNPGQRIAIVGIIMAIVLPIVFTLLEFGFIFLIMGPAMAVVLPLMGFVVLKSSPGGDCSGENHQTSSSP